MNQLLSLLKPLLKDCWQLVALKSEFSDKYAFSGRIGGPVYADEKADENEFKCVSCNKTLDFIFQFRTNLENDSGYLVQVFYCLHCLPIGAEEDKGQWQIRTYSPQQLAHLEPVGFSGSKLKFCRLEARKINLLPDYEDLEENHPEIIEILKKMDSEDIWEVYDQASEALGCPVEPVSTIGGYPAWLQGPVNRQCPVCDKNMEFLGQLDSEPEAGLMWGDAGCLYIFRCKEHTEHFAIEMQCF